MSVGDEVESHHHDAMGHHHHGAGVGRRDHRVVASHDEPLAADRDDRATCDGLVTGHGAMHRAGVSVDDGAVSHHRDATDHRAVASDPCHRVGAGSDPVVDRVGASHDGQNHADRHALAARADHHVAVASDPDRDAAADHRHVASRAHRDDRARVHDDRADRRDRHLSMARRDGVARARVDRCTHRVRVNVDAVAGTIDWPRAP